MIHGRLRDQERFIHWETAFPTVWDRWYDPDPQGGFDAVIGNPPWDRIELQLEVGVVCDSEVRKRCCAHPTAAANRKGLIDCNS